MTTNRPVSGWEPFLGTTLVLRREREAPSGARQPLIAVLREIAELGRLHRSGHISATDYRCRRRRLLDRI